MIINRHNIGWAFALALVATHLSVEAQNYYTGPQPSYRPFVVSPNGAVILGRAVEQANGIREQYNEAAQFSANQRQLYLADQQARARYLQRQNQLRLQYEQAQRIHLLQYGHANSTPSYAVPSAPISVAQQNHYAQQSYNQYRSRQSTLSQWGQPPLPTPYYQQARRICSNDQVTWYC